MPIEKKILKKLAYILKNNAKFNKLKNAHMIVCLEIAKKYLKNIFFSQKGQFL